MQFQIAKPFVNRETRKHFEEHFIPRLIQQGFESIEITLSIAQGQSSFSIAVRPAKDQKYLGTISEMITYLEKHFEGATVPLDDLDELVSLEASPAAMASLSLDGFTALRSGTVVHPGVPVPKERRLLM